MAGENAPVGGEPKPAFTEEQNDAIIRAINKVVNGQTAAFRKQIAEANDATTVKIAAMLEEKLQNFKPVPEEKEEGKGKKDKGDSVELQSLRKEISELRTAADRERATAAEERSKSRTMTLRSAAIDQLARIGISGNNARLALNCLLQDQRIAFDTDVAAGEVDEIVFRSDDEGWVKLDLGLKSWAKSSDAKVFLPAAGVTGAGSRPGTSPMPSAVKMSDEERKRVLGEYLDRNL
jgi:hypothetical protein